ncbi:MAG TPA: hypothetical protein VHF01_07680 [Candidatus Acidoferrum sp.]|nr:hypothetical protein [Candidatus Acidoferrum sp.]
MIATFLALFWFPVRRTFANVEVNYNEGWNAYRAAMVASGIRLYGSPPNSFTGGAYPPLSFHLIAWLGTTSTFPAVGRGVSLISLILTGVFVSLIVRRGGASRQTAVFSFLLYEIGIAILRADRIGMNDPQLLAEALSAAGLYFYVRNPDSNRLLCVSALLFCLSGFTKQTSIAFPLAIAIGLLVRSRKRFATFAGAMLLSAGLLTAMTLLVDGRYFPLHLMSGRAYSYWLGWSNFHHYVLTFQSLIVIGTAWSMWAFRSRTVLASAFVLSHFLAFLLAGGFGVDLNIFFNALAAAVVVCGIALSEITFGLAEVQPAAVNSSAALMFALLFISIMIFVPGQLRRDHQEIRFLRAHETEFQSAVEFVKTRPGPALCESLLLCYDAGKPFEYEPFTVRDQVKTGRLQEEKVLQLLRTSHFQTVQIALRSDEEDLKEIDLRASLSSDQKAPDTERRFTPKFMKELLEDYQLSIRTSQMAIFCPK